VLDIRFSTRAGRVQISCDPALADALQALKARFASGESISLQSFDVELDELLANLYELAQWPASDTNVAWQAELRELVEANVADASVASGSLTAGGATNQVGTPVALDGDWKAGLTPFQNRDLQKLLQLRHGANFSVPGAGKTRVALAAFQSRRNAGEVKRMLVVCPKSAFEAWIDEVQLCFPDKPPRVAVFGEGPTAADVLLVNYERLPEAHTVLLHWLQAERTLLVLDEAHRMKAGPLGVWGAICLSLSPHAARRLILTGTPAPNGVRDLENLMAFVWPGQGRAAVRGATTTADLRAASVALRPLFTRTTKKELGLPKVDIATRPVELPPIHRDLYNALLGQAASQSLQARDLEALGHVLLYLLMAATTPALLATGSSRYEPLPYRVPPLAPPANSTLAELLRDLPLYELSPKYLEAASIVAENSQQGRKTLIWSTFVRNLTSLAELLSDFSPAVVHGGTEDRAEQLRRFRNDPDCLVLLSNPATLGEGVSLHHTCHEAIYIDRDFAAGRFLQSLDRIHRLGLPPDTKTRIVLLVASETIDELVDRRLATKLEFMGRILDDPEVEELGDLGEEPSVTIGMDTSDVQSLLTYVRSGASS
jgi:SNF2 family DNA or RNA helicase